MNGTPHESTCTRRAFLGGLGLGPLALAHLLHGERRPAPHFAPRAKNVVWLFMAGAPSQLDLFEPKPALQKHDGQPVPQELIAGQRFAFLKGTPRLLGTRYRFAQRGQCGAPVSELLPHLASIVDKVAFVKSLHTEQFNHGPAQIFMNTGHQIAGRPSCGSWVQYGLGSEATDLPGFVVLVSGKIDPGAGAAAWSSGFLPTPLQGVELRARGEPVPCVADPQGVDRAMRRRTLDLLGDLNRERLATLGDPEIAARIDAYELAFRMQASVPELVDLRREPDEVHRLYGSEPGKPSFANNCLLARRMVERGVRFVQLFHRGWDHHGTDASDDLEHGLPKMCEQTDRAATALVLDLERRGLLDETLVVWGGEFGRTPMQEVRDAKFLGRDHHGKAFTFWLAGGGVRGGVTHGATDELGYHVAQDPVHVNDLHATMLHLLGLDHERLTWRFQGRDYRLTDVGGKVVRPLLA
ncbi:MAG: DUF1501 domain-containing protein [Planctomycetes bacterium]|nr:DUF1501 domain-containing protein [Planctomycetota bacterium]